MRLIPIVALLVAGVAAFAAVGAAATYRAPPTVAAAAELGVGLDELVACSTKARGDATQAAGSPERKIEVEGLVLACLQQDHPEISAPQLAAAEAKYHTIDPG